MTTPSRKGASTAADASTGLRPGTLRRARPGPRCVVHLARDLLEHHGALDRVIEERARGGELDALRHLGPEPRGEIERRSACRASRAPPMWRAGTARAAREHHLTRARRSPARGRAAARVGHAFSSSRRSRKKIGHGSPLDPDPKRFEEDQDDDRGERPRSSRWC